MKIAEAIEGCGEAKDGAGIEPRPGGDLGKGQARGAVREGVEDGEGALDGLDPRLLSISCCVGLSFD